ncbi:MAG: histone deacetylase family protein [Deltaproteobacteria bacterium]|nr:histone deacetylase family protein [Deltaproteobacteria bacterium]
MKIVYSELEKLHHPQYEFSFGKLVPYPEKNIRAQIILEELKKRSMGDLVVGPDEFPLDHLKAVTDPEMVDFIQSCEHLKEDESVFPHIFPYRDFTPDFSAHPRINLKKAGYYAFDVGIEIDRDTFTAAKASVDVALTGADLIRSGREERVFSLCRPPGHHAGYSHFGGYCIFNNAAVAAHYLSTMGKIAILDVDFHHGNGTQGVFYEQPEILYVSLHGDPAESYPYFSGFADETGSRLGCGTNVNIPLPAGIGDDQYRKYLEQGLLAVSEFHPEVLIVSLGLDIYKEDPLSNIGVSSGFFSEIAARVCSLNIPVLGILEGGYDMRDLGVNGANFIESLATTG